MAQNYNYKLLTEPDSIRLVELHPASNASAVMRCSLIHTSLSLCDNQDIYCHYTALSYVWGSPNKIKTIWIDEMPLKITANLFLALEDLRHQSLPLLLWADGICINQEDNEEKAMQILLMGQIYARALNTVLYLGPADAESDQLKYLSAIRQGRYEDAQKLVATILNREWFTRVWVFQELVFSVNPWLQCGRMRVKWHEVFDSLEKGELEWGHKTAVDMWQAWNRHHGKHPVYDPRPYGIEEPPDNSMIKLLQARRGLGVSDPRDMVFAHVGFAVDGQHKDITIDYNKTCAKVYADFARYIGGKYGITTLLDHIGDGSSSTRMKDLASWVPDWTMPEFTSPYLSRYTDDFAFHKVVTIWDQETVPVFWVNCCDTVLSISSQLEIKKIPRKTRRRISFPLHSIKHVISAFNVPDRNFVIRYMQSDRRTLLKLWPEVYGTWREIVSDDNILPQQPIDLQLGTETHNDIVKQPIDIAFLLLLAFHKNYGRKYFDGRRLARMSSGKLALVPGSTQKGDLIARFYKGLDIAREFLFHPLQLDNKRRSVDTKILAKSLGWIFASNEDFLSFEPHVEHCNFIGDCFLDRGDTSMDFDGNFIALY